MDNSVLQDLQDYYAQQYGLTLVVCDSEYNLVSEISGSNTLAHVILGDPPDLNNLFRDMRIRENYVEKPLIYDLIPGLKSIVSAFQTHRGLHFVWTGVFIEPDTREFVNTYINQHAVEPRRWGKALELAPEMTPEIIFSVMQRIVQLQSIVTLELNKNCSTGQISQESKTLQAVQNMLGCVMKPDSSTDKLLQRILACDDRIQLVGFAERIDTERFGIRQVLGDDSSHLVGCEFLIGEGFLGYTAITQVPGYWDNANRDPRSMVFLRHGVHPESVFCHPLKRGNHVTGVLFGVSQSRLDKETLDFLEIMATAFNIDHVKQQLLDDLHGQSLQLSMMTELSRTMTSIQDLKSILLILVDMSLNLVQGKFSCLVFKPFGTDSIRVMSRGVTSERAASYGRELANLYFTEGRQQPDMYTPQLRQVCDSPVLECQILCHNRVVGVLSVAISDEEESEKLGPLLSILSTLGTVGLQRVYDEAEAKHSRKTIRSLQQAMSFWDQPAYELTTAAAELAQKFAQYLGFKPSEIEILTHAAFIEPYDIELIHQWVEDGAPDIVSVLQSYHSLQTDPAILDDTFSSVDAQVLALAFGHLRSEDKMQKYISDEMKSKFNTFLLLKATETQELVLPKTAESFSCMERLKELTAREEQILELLVRGLGNKDIAQTLFISEHTVKNHLTNIFQKLGVSDRMQAIAAVYQSKQ